MRSRSEQRKQPTSYEDSRQKVAVKPQGYAGVQSLEPAQVEETSREGQDDLLEKMLGRENLQLALKRVRQNGGAAGVDGKTVQELPGWLRDHWPEVKDQLLTGAYRPMPVKRVEIPKPGGGTRLLGIPTVLDRLLQQALLQVTLEKKVLGFSFLANKEATIRIAARTLERLKDRIREITSRTWAMSVEKRIGKLNTYLIGWIGYFQLAAAKKHCAELDGWIRRRLRMCFWKQWKTPRTRLRNLRALGVPEWAACRMAKSQRGPWEMSRNMNNALASAYWQKQGLKSLLGRYNELRQLLGSA